MRPPMLDPLSDDGPEPGCAPCQRAAKSPQAVHRGGIAHMQCPGCTARSIATSLTAWRVLAAGGPPAELSQAIAVSFPDRLRKTGRTKVWAWWRFLRGEIDRPVAMTPTTAPAAAAPGSPVPVPPTTPPQEALL